MYVYILTFYVFGSCLNASSHPCFRFLIYIKYSRNCLSCTDFPEGLGASVSIFLKQKSDTVSLGELALGRDVITSAVERALSAQLPPRMPGTA